MNHTVGANQMVKSEPLIHLPTLVSPTMYYILKKKHHPIKSKIYNIKAVKCAIVVSELCPSMVYLIIQLNFAFFLGDPDSISSTSSSSHS